MAMGCPKARGPLTYNDYPDYYDSDLDSADIDPDFDAGFKNCAEPDAIGTYYSIVSNFEFE